MFAGVSRRALISALVAGLVLGIALFWADGQINQRLGTVEIGIAFGPADAESGSEIAPSTSLPSTPSSQPNLDEIVETSTTTSTTTIALTLPSNVDQTWLDEVLFGTNTERLKEGLDALTSCGNLHVAAQTHAVAMLEQDFFEHENPFTGDDPSSRAMQAGYGSGAGENIAMGYVSPRDVVRAWMDSPGHRENILGSYEHLGIGITLGGSGTNEKNERFYWVQNFGSGGDCS